MLARGLKSKEISGELGITEGTVKVYLSHLFQKSGAKDRFELALQGLKNLGMAGISTDQVGPAAAGAGRAEGRISKLYLIRYARSPPTGLKDSTAWPAFFIAPAMNPRAVCFCHPMLSYPRMKWRLSY